MNTALDTSSLSSAPPATAVTAGTKYWIAILSPNGMLKFRDRLVARRSPAKPVAQTTLTSLSNTWTTGTVLSERPLVGYGAGY